MADLSDVEQALVTLIAGALYPNGITAPSVTGAPTRIYRGWPNVNALDADLLKGVVNVTVYPSPNMTRKTTRYSPIPVVVSAPASTLTATVSGRVATFAGTCSPGQLAGVSYGSQAWAYVVQATDTPTTVAAALAGLSGGTASGAELTLSTNQPIKARTSTAATTSTELRRQQQGIMVSVWAPTPQARDAGVVAADLVLAETPWVALPDGTSGWMLYHGTEAFDQSQNANLYRRDITVTVEYATTLTQLAPSILFPEMYTAADGGPYGPALIS